MQKFSYLETKFQSTSKDYPHEQVDFILEMQRELNIWKSIIVIHHETDYRTETMIISLNEKKRPLTNPLSIHDNCSGVSRDARDILQHNKDNIQKTHRQYHSRQRFRNSYIFTKTRMSIFHTSVQHST